MKILTFVFIFFCFTINALSQSGWVALNPGTTNTLTDLYFIDNNTGFAVTKSSGSPVQNTIIKTTNGGLNWNIVYNQNSAGLKKMQFFNNTTGYIKDTSGYLKTTNIGNTWVHYALPAGVRAYYFIDALTGFGIADSARTLKTTDGGDNWDQISNQHSAIFNIQTLYFINSTTGFLLGLFDTHEVGYYTTASKTTNGGLSWVNMSIGAANAGSLAVFGRDSGSDTLFCFFPNNNFRSTNTGGLWSQLTTNPIYGVYSFSSPMRSTDWITSLGYEGNMPQLYKSTNGGTNWIANPYFPAVPLYAVNFPTELIGYIGGAFGALYKTTNGGVVTGFTQTSSEIPERFSLAQNYPNPFNPNTLIKWEIPTSSFVSLKVYDAIGNEVEALVNEKQNPGSYSINFNGASFPSGVYFYKLIYENNYITKKMLLIK